LENHGGAGHDTALCSKTDNLFAQRKLCVRRINKVFRPAGNTALYSSSAKRKLMITHNEGANTADVNKKD
jgi:hypothetical protein